MLLVEHHGKQLLTAYGIPVPAGMLIRQAQQVRRWRKPFPIALKVQIAAGGRGKAGGVVRADNVEQAQTAAQCLFSAKFDGEEPSALLLEPWLAHERELYLSITIDGGSGGYVLLYAPAGGVEVERHKPLSYPIGVTRNFRAHELRPLISSIEPDDALCARVVALARQLLFVIAATDATTIEINPTAVLPDGKLVALDAKIVRDDAAAFRHADIADQVERARKKEPRAVAQALAGNLMMVSRVLIHGIAGNFGRFSARDIAAYGTKVVAGVAQGYAGREVEQVPVFPDVRTACRETHADAALVYVPANRALDAILETCDAGCNVVVYLGEIGGYDENAVAAYAQTPHAKPVAALIVGLAAPPGKKMGHAAAMIGSLADTQPAKVAALRSAGVYVAHNLRHLIDAVNSAIVPGKRDAQD